MADVLDCVCVRACADCVALPDMTKKRTMLYEGGGCNGVQIVKDRASAKAQLQRPEDKDKVWDGLCFNDDDKELIKRVMVAVYSADISQMRLRKSQLEKQQLAASDV